MRRKLSLAIAFIGVLGLVGFAPVAQAGHDLKDKDNAPHENSPAPPVPQEGGTCVVIGDVFIGNAKGTGGVSATDKNHNHYKFGSVDIECTDGDPHYEGAFAVEAAGGTDGLSANGPKEHDSTHGESASAGWSHQACYDDDNTAKAPQGCDPPANHKDPKVDLDDLYDGTKVNPPGNANGCENCGEIEVRSLDAPGGTLDGRKNSVSTENYVKFCRGVYDDGLHSPATCSNVLNGGTNASTGGSNVLAWGQLNDWTGKPTTEVLCFLAELEFIPVPAEKINQATLVGEAQTWVTNDKTDCEGKKNLK